MGHGVLKVMEDLSMTQILLTCCEKFDAWIAVFFLFCYLLLLLIFFACISDCRVAEVAPGQERHPLTKVEPEEQASATIIMDEYQYFDVHQLICNHNSLNRWRSNLSLCL